MAIEIKINSGVPDNAVDRIRFALLHTHRINAVEATNAARNFAPLASGRLRASLTPNVLNVLHWQVLSQGEAGNYFFYAEHGRRPGKWPPRDRIMAWLVESSQGQSFVASVAASYELSGEQALRSAAFLVQRKIGEDGTLPGSGFAARTEQQGKPFWEMRTVTAVESVLNEILG